MKSPLTLLSIISLFVGLDANAQGCSDAGLCSSGNMQSSGNDNQRSNLTVSFPYAMGENRTSIFSIQPEWNCIINKNSQIQLKLPYTFVSGDLGQSSGLGDPILSYSLLIHEMPAKDSAKKDVWQWYSTVGGRFGINDAAKTGKNDRPLPMPYQTSLGTYDIIFGVSVQNNDWHFSLGYQQPLIHNNFNDFHYDSLSSTKEFGFAQSGNLRRNSDVMFRVERTIEGKDWKFTGGLLPIYHIGNDRYTDTSGRKWDIEGSKGLTLNINFNLNFRWTENMSFGLLFGMPLIVRDARPDGLTRAFVASPYFVWRY